MDAKSKVKIYSCKTILNRLRGTSPNAIYRLQLRLSHDYEKICSLCEENRLAKEWRYPSGGGARQNGIIKIGRMESCCLQEKGVLQAVISPFVQKEEKDKGLFCYLLTKASVSQERSNLLEKFRGKGYYALSFTATSTIGLDKGARILHPLTSLFLRSPRGLLDLRIEKGTLLIPRVASSLHNRCIIKSAAKWQEEIFVIAEPLLENALVITQGEEATLFIQGIGSEKGFSLTEFRWVGVDEDALLGHGRYLDLSALRPGSHYLTCRVVGSNNLSDVAALNVIVHPNPRLNPASLFVRPKREGSEYPDIRLQFDTFVKLSEKINRIGGKQGWERFYQITRKVGEVELQLKTRLLGCYLQQGDHFFSLDPELVDSYFKTIENLQRLSSQKLSKLFKATTRLLVRHIYEQESLERQRQEIAHFFESINTFVDNDFPKEEINDLLGRVPFEPDDHDWIQDLYAQRGLYESALKEAKLTGRENLLDKKKLFQERFQRSLANKEFKEVKPKRPRKGKKSNLYVDIEVLNTKTGKYEAFQTELQLKKGEGYLLAPLKLSEEYFDKNGNLKLRLSENAPSYHSPHSSTSDSESEPSPSSTILTNSGR
ncbi:TPA: hypothetical protein DCX15_02840 [bacterium]|nr:hypothetical protein [bacterium]